MSTSLLSAPDGLLFDMDGVLADVRNSYRASILATLEEFGCPISAEELSAAKRRTGVNNDWVLTRQLMAERGIRRSLDEVTEIFQSYYLGTSGRTGFREEESLLLDPEVLTRLAERFPLGIVTGRPRDEAVWFLDRFRISGHFRTLVGMEDAPAKPSPEGVQIAMTALGVRTAWMMGDTPDDMIAARGADAIPFGVLTGINRSQEQAALLSAGARIILTTIKDLERYLP